MRRVVLAAALAALAFPAGASAHATLKKAFPPFGAELRATPRTVELHFDQAVRILPHAVHVLNTNGVDLAGPARVVGTSVVAQVKPLRRGAYTVRWEAISADSHVVSGVWTFGLGVKAAAVTDAYGAGGPTVAEHVVRWLWFLALALTIGALGLRLIVLRGLAVPRSLDRRIAVAAGLGAAVALQVGIAAFSLRSEDALQLPLGKFLYADLSPIAVTRFGRAFIAMTLAFGLLLALVYLAWLLDRVRYLVPAFAIAVVFAGGLSWSGHDAVDPGSSWWSVLADWVHIVAASLWVGGLGTMAVLLWRGAPDLRRVAFTRFSRLATVLVALVLGAGTYLSVVRLPHLHDLWSTGYGQVLIAKLSLVAVALAWGAFHQFVVRPALDRADAGLLARVSRSLAGELAVAAAVLLAAGVLVDSRPPPQPGPAPAAVGVVR